MYLFAIDPGPQESGWIELLDGRILAHGKSCNNEVLRRLCMAAWDEVRIERVVLRGKAGNDLRTTCEWVGRFDQASADSGNGPARLVPRSAVHGFYGTVNDSEVIREVKRRYPFDLAGITKDQWQALALALMEFDP